MNTLTPKLLNKISKISQELGTIKTDSSAAYGNTDFKYISLDSLLEKIRPHLKKHKLCLTFDFSHDTAQLLIYDFEVNNEEDDNSYQNNALQLRCPFIISDKMPDKLKAMGACMTYTKRYLLGNLFNFVTSKDHEAETKNMNHGEIKFETRENKETFKCYKCNNLINDTSSSYITKDGKARLMKCPACSEFIKIESFK